MIKGTVLVLGSAGQLGSDFQRALVRKGLDFSAPDESDCSVTDFEQIGEAIKSIKPAVVVNCAAYNAVDEAEDEPEPAYLINGRAVENLAVLCREANAFLVHYSSDYVFDGGKQDFYREEDTPNPINVYGKSKLSGERAVMANMSDFLIFRLSWVIGNGEQNFLFKLSNWAERNRILRISSDEVSVPTFTEDVINVTLWSMDRGLRGLYHLTNGGYASRYELARHYVERKGLNNVVVPVALSSFETRAKRPMFSVMSNRRISEELGVVIPTWQDALDRFIG
ncbi:MAG: dTDP-4-dehydrorhamnose reductase [Proteobacteria bacterium]|nr:dTDP-4-dehydrorhamnose reductase [Pseudomonadota bacterium]